MYSTVSRITFGTGSCSLISHNKKLFPALESHTCCSNPFTLFSLNGNEGLLEETGVTARGKQSANQWGLELRNPHIPSHKENSYSRAGTEMNKNIHLWMGISFTGSKGGLYPHVLTIPVFHSRKINKSECRWSREKIVLQKKKKRFQQNRSYNQTEQSFVSIN